jgi:putative ABC transport system permease protein
MVALNENNIPRSMEIELDSRVLIFTIAVSILTGILFGLAPALHFSKTDLHTSLKEGGRSVVSDSRKRLRSALVIAEMALALVLLIGAGLMIKSFRRLNEVNPGFNPQNVLAMQLSLPLNKYEEPAQMNAFYGQAIEQIKALPGVQSAGFTSILPLSGNNESGSFYIEHHDVPQGQQPPHGDRWRVTSGYMQTMDIPLIRGRYFSESDNADGQGVAIIDEMLAKKYWPNEDPIGQRIAFEGDRAQPRYREVVGVVGHVKHSGLEGESRAQYYVPVLQNQSSGLYLAVRTTNDPASLTPAVRGVFKNLDPDLPVYKVTTMERLVSDSMARQRFSVVLLGTFAGVALLLAAIGIYGVMAYSVSQRTSEIGIRMALGAQAYDVLKLVISQGMFLIGIGLAIGITVAVISTRLMSSLLFGVSATDPTIFVLISATLAGVALLACYIPARRATRVDPMMALRDE